MEKKFRKVAKKAVNNCLSFHYLITFELDLVLAIGQDKAYSIYEQERQKAKNDPNYSYFGIRI